MEIQNRTYSTKTVLSLMKEGLNPVLAKVLAARGIQTSAEISYDMDSLIHYSQLTGAKEMASILCDAILAGKRLLIVADYDADGATACAVGLRGLQEFGANVDFIIPDRLKDGYGLSVPIAEAACQVIPKPDYIVTVDCGIASHDGIAECNRRGVPVLVTDHHLPGDTHPAAACIVNPNQIGCKFPSKALAGCGVMWYVMWALQDEFMNRKIGLINDDYSVKELLPIVAIGTVADVVALDANNRILVAEGLKRIRSGNSFVGIENLITVSGKDKATLSTTDIAFAVAPRINAAGRLDSMNAGVECLTTDDPSVAEGLAIALNDKNNRRKEIEGDMVDEAVRKLLTDVKPDRYSAVLHAEDWHHGVIGIVAGRLKELIWRPTFTLASGHEGELKGSGRSIPGFHLRDALDLIDRRNPGLLPKFGGHAMAAGVTIREGGLDQFGEAFELVARELLTPADLNQILMVDGPLETSEISLKTVALIKEQVWGQAFQEPVFLDEFIVVEGRSMGNGKHMSLTLQKDGQRFKAVKFRHTEAPPLPQSRIVLAYKLADNPYRGQVYLQLMIEAIGSVQPPPQQ